MNTYRIVTKHVDDECTVFYSAYLADGSVSIEFKEWLSGEPVLRATVCLAIAGETPAPGNVFIKDWEENEGVRECLESLGIIGPVIREIPVNDVVATEHQLLAR